MWHRVQFETASERVARALYEEKRSAGLRPIWGRKPFGWYVAWHEADTPAQAKATGGNHRVAYI